MISPDYCRAMANYNAKVNRQLYELCSSIPEDQLMQERGLFFGSIYATLNHLLYGDISWLVRFLNKPEEVPEIDELLHPNFSELKVARELWDKKLVDWCEQVTDAWLAESFSYTSKVDGNCRTRPAWLLVAHMFNHETHHRGQVSTVLSQLGLDYGVTDLPFIVDS